ncbi:MAG: hypothetical protein J6O49_19050 [Bacteroidaceae bacterium]|nr:hypothetical protein [Bacteroidaceae bacterium]
MAKKRGMRITPEQMIAQWRPLRHKFQLNVWNFQVEVAKAAVEVFQMSFELHRFNTNNSMPWRERRKNYKHPILKETGTLKNSIRYKKLTKSSMRVFTAPSQFGTAARHKGFCYAAVHNDPSGSHTYGHTGVRSIQRQFMGYSSILDKKVRELSVQIFNGFPK